jgi:arylformamidase
MKIIDITQELFSCFVYPDDKPPIYERVKTIEHDKYNLTNISMSVHNGTHIDAPNHFIANGKAVHELDLSNVNPGEYILCAFPLNMQDSDGSPVRAVLIDKK